MPYSVVCGVPCWLTRDHQGPIVRINPFELHIQDSKYWDDLYTGHKEYERYAWMSGRFGANTTTSSTVGSQLHAIRRAPLNPMFSKRSITKLEPLVHEKVELLSTGLAAYDGTGRVVCLNDAFNAFAGDVITSYCFGFSYDQLKSRDFRINFHSAYEAVRQFAHFGLQFPVAFIVSRAQQPHQQPSSPFDSLSADIGVESEGLP